MQGKKLYKVFKLNWIERNSFVELNFQAVNDFFYSKLNKQIKSHKSWIIESKTETKTKRKKSSISKIIFNTFNFKIRFF